MSSDNGSMNKKLIIIPALVLSSALLFVGCNLKNDNYGELPNSNSSNSSTPAPTLADTTPDGMPVYDGYIAPPSDLEDKYKGSYFAPSTLDAEAWSVYKEMGATTYKEDASVRSVTDKDWADAAANRKDSDDFIKMYAEVNSDVEQTAVNVAAYVKENPSATLEEINGSKGLIINRYDKAGKTVVEQDAKTNFYFVIFSLNNDGNGGYSILVPQEGITPDFSAS